MSLAADLRHMNLAMSSNTPGLLSEPPLSPGPAPEPLASSGPVGEPPAPQLGAVEPAPVPAPAPAPAPEPDPALDPKPGLPVEAQLVRMGLMTLDQLADANRERLETGKTVAQIAVERGWVSAQDLAVLTADAPPLQTVPAPAPEPAPEPLQQVAPAPVPAPAPAPPPAPAAPEPVAPVEPVAAPTKRFRLALRLHGGERFEVEAFADEEAAKTRAREIVFDLTRPRADEWPFYAGRFVRPESILSVDVLADE